MRALELLLHGDIRHAFHVNPVGLLVCFAIVAAMIVKGIDLAMDTNYTQAIFSQSFQRLRRNHVGLYIVFLLFCLFVAMLNGFWNYKKGL